MPTKALCAVYGNRSIREWTWVRRLHFSTDSLNRIAGTEYINVYATFETNGRRQRYPMSQCRLFSGHGRPLILPKSTTVGKRRWNGQGSSAHGKALDSFCRESRTTVSLRDGDRLFKGYTARKGECGIAGGAASCQRQAREKKEVKVLSV